MMIIICYNERRCGLLRVIMHYSIIIVEHKYMDDETYDTYIYERYLPRSIVIVAIF